MRRGWRRVGRQHTPSGATDKAVLVGPTTSIGVEKLSQQFQTREWIVLRADLIARLEESPLNAAAIVTLMTNCSIEPVRRVALGYHVSAASMLGQAELFHLLLPILHHWGRNLSRILLSGVRSGQPALTTTQATWQVDWKVACLIREGRFGDIDLLRLAQDVRGIMFDVIIGDVPKE